MMAYFVRRLLWFIPSLVGISVLLFFLAQAGSSDPVVSKWEKTDLNPQQKIAKIKEDKQKLGLDLPSFYFSFHRQTVPDTLHRIYNSKLQDNLTSLAYEVGSWEAVHHYYAQIKKLHRNPKAAHLAEELLQLKSKKELTAWLALHENERSKSPELFERIKKLLAMEVKSARYRLSFQWNGTASQYHQWLSGLFFNQWDRSILSGQKEGKRLYKALQWTFCLSLLSMLLALLIAIPCGIQAALNPASLFDRICSTLFFGFYSIPNFWMATLLLILFASGSFLNWFPLYGVGEINASMSLGELLQIRLSHLALPLFCWTYGSLAYFFRQLRSALLIERQENYFIAAQAKGLSERMALWKHAFRNALLPLISIIGGALPALISGSIIIESIFNLPGLGRLSVEAFLARDYPLIFTIVLLGAILTLLGTFLADLAYHWADPRIRMQKQKA